MTTRRTLESIFSAKDGIVFLLEAELANTAKVDSLCRRAIVFLKYEEDRYISFIQGIEESTTFSNFQNKSCFYI